MVFGLVEQLKQKDVTELLARADDLAVQNTSYQEVYSAMAKSLAEAWKDLNKQLEYRKMLLDQSIAFHESALQVSGFNWLITECLIDWLIDCQVESIGYVESVHKFNVYMWFKDRKLKKNIWYY